MGNGIKNMVSVADGPTQRHIGYTFPLYFLACLASKSVVKGRLKPEVSEPDKDTGTLTIKIKMAKIDEKETDKDTEFIKEENKSTRKYIFQKNTITKVATIIVIAFLILLVIGLVASGTSLFDGS
ncbi:hypothetical protein [Pareuzebyella sediminis]|uniref:hypothetical protein n=2 Tax=Pareuzebyella sediminis TaxID=2607998 RepID=UPI0011EDB953|nr:hypothetical protein [Pareuzebyella sediminis]